MTGGDEPNGVQSGRRNIRKSKAEVTEGATSAAEGAEHPYSRAYENIVSGPDDLVGQLAYALFKSSVREEARRGNYPDRARRDPTPMMVDAFRRAAEQQISELVRSSIEEARPDIEQNAMTAAIAGLESEITCFVGAASPRCSRGTRLRRRAAAAGPVLAALGDVPRRMHAGK